jgi:2,4-dienoyl-CoA reductase-like NADH-dependent reductase (Old Yellow Enzyme family)
VVDLGAPLALPCGAILPNRLAKAAMSEQLADGRGRPTDALCTLYQRWAHSGAGLLVTGNVLVDRTQPVEPFNVVVDDVADAGPLVRWAEAGRAGGAHVWMQLNHPGRQAPRMYNRRPVAPSAVAVRSAVFGRPRALSGAEIDELVARFGTAAAVAERAGFDGVQLHAAHGYLVSQFLSPLANRRDDGWGGDLAGRMRFLLEVVRSMRAAVSSRFAVAVKLNSADFQRGGFSLDEAVAVVTALNDEAVDLVEVTGGTFEAPVVSGDLSRRGRTAPRQAFFLDYARALRVAATMPLMLTGGIRTLDVMRDVVGSGAVDMIGLARPMAVAPELPRSILEGEAESALPQPRRIGWRLADLALDGAWHAQQLARMSRGHDPDPRRGRLRTLAAMEATLIRWRLARRG